MRTHGQTTCVALFVPSPSTTFRLLGFSRLAPKGKPPPVYASRLWSLSQGREAARAWVIEFLSAE